MTDWLSALLGGTLLRLVVGGTVVVSMALVLRGEYLLAAGLVVPLLAIVALAVMEAGLLE